MNQFIVDEMNKRDDIINSFNKNYLLEAGAGAGKTTLIVQRIINHILNNDIDPTNLVAITFTKAASTELSERIQKKALEYLIDEKDPLKINRLQSVDKIFTGTIHSFCELILSELPFDASLTPGYEIIEDEKEFHRNIWYNFLRDKQEEYKELVDLLKDFGIDYLRLNTSALLALNNPDIKFIGYDSIDYNEVFTEFEDIKEKYKDLKYKDLGKQKSIARLVNPLLEEGGDFKDYINKFYNAFNGKDFVFDIDELYSGLIKKGTVIEEPDKFKDLINDLYNLNLKIQITKYNACTEFVNMVVKYKEENYKGKLTFNDLLYKASKLIKESEDARNHFKNKYKYFYVDEFQDTDPIQAELVLYLTHNGDYNNISAWQDLNPTPGSLFVVGDPKQSIYRFRRADISTYNKVKEMIQKTGEIVYLDINFRSSNDICKWVQDTFKKTDGSDFGFGEESSSYQAGFKKILSLWDDKMEDVDTLIKQISGVYYYDYPDKEEEYVANIIKDLIDNFHITEKVKRDEIDSGGKDYYNEIRKIKESDIMLLTKTNEETGVYLKALKERGISALLSGEKILGNTREVLNLYLLIDALIDYRDNIKVVSALRNSFYIDLETIDLILEDDKNLLTYIFNKKKQDKITHPSLKKAFESMNEMISMTRHLSPIAFLEKIIENKIGIFDIGREYGDLELKDANSSLRQTVEILKSKNCNSFYELREELRNLKDKKVNNELPLDDFESKNAVRIMNIHKAKGLEAGIVILAGGFKYRSASLNSPCHFVSRNESNENIGYINYPQDNIKTSGPNEEQNRAIEKCFIEAELDRLLYVAATRAKSALLVANAEGEASFLYPLSSRINADREIKVKDEKKYNLLCGNLSSEKEKELNLTKDLRIQKEICSPSYIKLTPSKFKIIGTKEKRSNILVIRGPKLKYYTRNDDKQVIFKGPRGPIYGTIVHRAIEILMKKSENLKSFEGWQIKYATERSLNEVVDTLELSKSNIASMYPIFSPKVDEVLELRLEKGNKEAGTYLKEDMRTNVETSILNFVNNYDIKELLSNAKEIYTELPFTIALNKDNREVYEAISAYSNENNGYNSDKKEFLVNGTIDLVVKNPDDSWTILDYKTNIIGTGNVVKTLKNLYTPQLEGYKILFEEILEEQGAEVKDLVIYSTYIDKLIYL